MSKKQAKNVKNLKPARKVKGGAATTAIKLDRQAGSSAKLLKGKVGFEPVSF